MTPKQQNIINDLSFELSNALIQCEHQRHEENGSPDKIDAYIKSYNERVILLRKIREQLENEFTIIHYDPR